MGCNNSGRACIRGMLPSSRTMRTTLPPSPRSKRQAHVPADGSTARRKCSSSGSKEAGDLGRHGTWYVWHTHEAGVCPRPCCPAPLVRTHSAEAPGRTCQHSARRHVDRDRLRREPRPRRWWRGVGLAARAADVHGRAAERRSGLVTQVQGKAHARGDGAVLWRCVAMQASLRHREKTSECNYFS